MIHYFNPGHETAVKNSSPYYTAPANIVSMQKELSFLPAWYGATGDLILTEGNIDSEFYGHLLENLPSLPKTITVQGLCHYPSVEVSLWGVSPQAIYYFQELNKEYEASLKVPAWNEIYTYLNSREAARDCLTEIISNIPEISKEIIPRFYGNLDDIEDAVCRSSQQLLAKAPYSSSGRGLLWLPITGLTRTERQILHGMLKKQGSVSVEKVLDRCIDFAMEFISDGNGNIAFAGYSLFYTNNKGAYQGNYLGSQEIIIKELTAKASPVILEKIKSELITVLKEKYAPVYKGCIGVDMLIYKEGEGYKVHPCLEINMRYNMGYLAVRLFENYIHPLSYGKYHLDFSSKEKEIYSRHKQMGTQYPTVFKDNRLIEGYLPLCPVDVESRYWAYIVVEKMAE